MAGPWGRCKIASIKQRQCRSGPHLPCEIDADEIFVSLRNPRRCIRPGIDPHLVFRTVAIDAQGLTGWQLKLGSMHGITLQWELHAQGRNRLRSQSEGLASNLEWNWPDAPIYHGTYPRHMWAVGHNLDQFGKRQARHLVALFEQLSGPSETAFVRPVSSFSAHSGKSARARRHFSTSAECRLHTIPWTRASASSSKSCHGHE